MLLPKLILASGSPRRAEILGSVGWDFSKEVAEVDEDPLPGEEPVRYVTRLALAKAMRVAAGFDKGIVLGADTIVVIDGRMIGKPAGLSEAAGMIRSLGGRWHEVLTGLALVDSAEVSDTCSDDDPESREAFITGSQITRVRFASLNEQEIEFLVNEGDPLDKAGAYAVQAQASLFIEKIEGDYWNVVGLPVSLLYKMISRMAPRDADTTANA